MKTGLEEIGGRTFAWHQGYRVTVLKRGRYGPRNGLPPLKKVMCRGEEKYRCRFYAYTFDPRLKATVARCKTVTLGLTSEMSPTQAHEKLRLIIDEYQEQLDKITAINSTNAGKQADVTEIPLHSRGAVAEVIACADLLTKGFEVFRSINPLGPTDLVIKQGKLFWRVEVKFGTVDANGNPVCRLRSTENFDVLAVVDAKMRASYFDMNMKPIFNAGHHYEQISEHIARLEAKDLGE